MAKPTWDSLTRRGMLSAAAAALVGAAAAACGPLGRGSGGGQPPGAKKAPVTLDIAAGGWVSPEDKELHRSVWQAFQQARPHVTLEINEIAFSTEKLLTTVAGGTPPDTAYIHPNDLPTVASQGAYRKLDEFVKADRTIDMKVYYPKVLEFFKFKGSLYQMPYYSGPSIMYYNKSLFKRLGVKLPEDYDKAGQWHWGTGFLDAARLLTQDRGDVQTYGSDGRAGLAFLCVPVWCNGGDFMNKELTESRFHMPQTVEALQAYADLWARYRAVIPTGSWTNFVEGHIGLIYGFRGMGPRFRQVTDFEVGMWHNPGGPAGFFTRSGPSGYGVVTGAKNPQEGWEFVKFYTGPVAQAILFTGGFNVPYTTRKEDLEAFRKSLAPWEHEHVYMESQGKRLRPLAPLPAKWGEINRVFGREWNALIRGEKRAQQAMTEIRSEIDSLLKGG